MKPQKFISERITFKGKLPVISMTVSFLVIIVALSVARGYRSEIRSRLSQTAGDIVLSNAGKDNFAGTDSIRTDISCMERIARMEGVSGIRKVACRAGIVRNGARIQGVLFKGTDEYEDTVRLGVSIPTALASALHLEKGDRMQAYFVSERLKARVFTVTGTYDSPIEAGGALTVYASLSDIQRINGWSANAISAFEITLDGNLDRDEVREKALEAGSLAMMLTGPDEEVPVCTAVCDKYPQIFDWLDLIDVNVLAILTLMIIVAGFNMISGLLIMLFRNMSTIGLLKSFGMTDRGIAGVFLRVAFNLVLKGMVAGTAIGVILVAVQSRTHFLKLDPSNYFVSFVPMELDIPGILTANVIAVSAVMILLLIPSLFISRIDPAKTLKAD